MNTDTMIPQLFAGFLIAMSASIMLEVPKKLLIKNGLIGIIAELVYLIAVPFLYDVTISVFLASLVVTLISQAFARIYRAPVTLFIIPVFFIFVPGAAIYKIVYYLIQKNPVGSSAAFVEALTISGAVALGVFFGDSLLEIYLKIKYLVVKKK